MLAKINLPKCIFINLFGLFQYQKNINSWKFTPSPRLFVPTNSKNLFQVCQKDFILKFSDPSWHLGWNSKYFPWFSLISYRGSRKSYKLVNTNIYEKWKYFPLKIPSVHVTKSAVSETSNNWWDWNLLSNNLTKFFVNSWLKLFLPTVNTTLNETVFSEDEFQVVFKSLKRNKVPGHDGLDVNIITSVYYRICVLKIFKSH